MDRSAWRQKIYRGSQHFEQQRRRQMDDKRNRRKERLVEAGLQQQRPADGCWMSHNYRRVCGSRIGLFSQQRIHR